MRFAFLDFCYAFIDDVLVAFTSEDEDEQRLCILLQRFSECGVLLNPDRCVGNDFTRLHSFS
jgi:hypothetical protein